MYTALLNNPYSICHTPKWETGYAAIVLVPSKCYLHRKSHAGEEETLSTKYNQQLNKATIKVTPKVLNWKLTFTNSRLIFLPSICDCSPLTRSLPPLMEKGTTSSCATPRPTRPNMSSSLTIVCSPFNTTSNTWNQQTAQSLFTVFTTQFKHLKPTNSTITLYTYSVHHSIQTPETNKQQSAQYHCLHNYSVHHLVQTPNTWNQQMWSSACCLLCWTLSSKFNTISNTWNKHIMSSLPIIVLSCSVQSQNSQMLCSPCWLLSSLNTVQNCPIN